MDEPEPPKLSQSLETLIDTGLFRHLSEDQQNDIVFEMIKDHDEYAKNVMDYYNA